LYGAACKNFQGNILRFEGFQREHEHAPTYFQEWLVTIIGERPPRGEIEYPSGVHR